MNAKVSKLVKKIQKNMDVSLVKEHLYFEGEGAFAQVFRVVNHPFIIRIGEPNPRASVSEDDVQELIKNPQDHVVKIYHYYKNKTKNIELVVMEVLEPLNEEISSILNEIGGIDEFLRYVDIENHEDVYEFLYGDTKEDDEEEFREAVVSNIVENADKLNEIWMGIVELESLGISHNDLHPANIMEDENGTIKIIDIF